MYDLNTNEFFESRNVVFSETKFHGVDTEAYVTPPLSALDPTVDDWLLPPAAVRGSSSSPTTTTPVQGHEALVSSSPLRDTPAMPTTASSVPSTTDISNPPTNDIPGSPPAPVSSSDEVQSTSPGIPEILRRGERLRTPSVLLKDYVTHSATLHPPSLSLQV